MISWQQNKDNAVILLYHGVTNVDSIGIENYSGKHISALKFENHLKHLKKYNKVLSMSELISHIIKKVPFPKYSVVITFDDGFENNYTVAYSLLKKYGVPATFFLSTYFIGTDRMFWVDLLEYAVNTTTKTVFDLNLDSTNYEFPIKTNKDKIGVLIRLKNHFKSLSDKNIEKLTEKIINYFEVDLKNTKNVLNYKKLSWQQVKEMSCSSLVEIGAHSNRHGILSKLSAMNLRREISISKAVLQNRISKEVNLFSYPEGRINDYNEEVIKTLKENGFIASPTAIYGYNSLGVDLFHLKRICVGFMGQPFPFSL